MKDLSLAAPPFLVYEKVLRRGLEEDLGETGDITTDLIVAPGTRAEGVLVARSAGRIAGIDVSLDTFSLLNAQIEKQALVKDGTDASEGQELARVSGDARAILTAERTALNLLGRLCGVATATRDIAAAVESTSARVVCTRKTTPGLRSLEKYAVRAGGASNHRYGLDDGVLIKDNHLLIAGSVREAVLRVRRSVGHMVTIEVEADTLDQVQEALELKVDAILLDNMSLKELERAVSLVQGSAILEASGGITVESALRTAQTGVDLLSVGWITHSAPQVDVGLDLHLTD